MSVDLGTDLGLLRSFDPLFLQKAGPALVLHAVYRRWTTDPQSVAGALIYRSQCRDIRQLLGSRGDAATDAMWEKGLAETAKADQRVDAATVRLTRSSDRKVLNLAALITISGVQSTLVIPFPSLVPEVILNG